MANHFLDLSACALCALQVPSAYYMTDVYLHFDALMNRKVFKPTATESRLCLAGCEGVKTKRLVGALRALWRSNKTKGYDARVTSLKSYLVPSPRRGAQAELEDSDHGDAHVSDHVDEDENVESGSEGENGAEGENAESGAESGADSGAEWGAEGENVEEKDAGGDGDVDGNSSSDDSLLNAPTLYGPPSHDEEEPSQSEETPITQSDAASEVVEDAYQAGDSQVPGAGWMGRAMMHFRKKEDKEEEKKEMKMWSLLSSIKSDLSKQFTEPIDGELWGTYSTFCRNAIEKDGEENYLKFASAKFFQSWVHNLKAEAHDVWVGGCWIPFAVEYHSDHSRSRAISIHHLSYIGFNNDFQCCTALSFLEVPDHDKAESKRTVDEVLQGLPSSLGGFVLVLVCVCECARLFSDFI